MKRSYAIFVLLVLILGGISFLGCEKDINSHSSAKKQVVGSYELAGTEDNIKEMKSIEQHIKKISSPPTNTYETLVKRIKESSQSEGNTESLIESVLNSEFLPLVYTRNNLQDGFDWFVENHNGLKELLRRNDAPEAIYKKYKRMPVTGYLPSATLEEKGMYSFKVLFLETILAQESILAKLPVNLLPEIAKTTFEKLNAKQQQPEVYGYFSNVGNAFVLARIMKIDNNLVSSNKKVNTFVEKGNTLSPEDMELILFKSKKEYLEHK